MLVGERFPRVVLLRFFIDFLTIIYPCETLRQ